VRACWPRYILAAGNTVQANWYVQCWPWMARRRCDRLGGTASIAGPSANACNIPGVRPRQTQVLTASVMVAALPQVQQQGDGEPQPTARMGLEERQWRHQLAIRCTDPPAHADHCRMMCQVSYTHCT
jgi:hypothetical protein